MPELNRPKLTAADLEQRIRGRTAELFGAALIKPEPSQVQAVQSTRNEEFQLGLEPPFDQSADGRYNLNDLLKHHDRNFIDNAYLAILKRGPDAAGFEAFAAALRSGRLNKVDLLARLRYSKEGRAKGVKVKGLLLPAAVRRSFRIPGLGYLLNWFVALSRLPKSQVSRRQFEAHEMAQKIQIVDFINELSRRINRESILRAERIQALSDRIELIKTSTDSLASQLGRDIESLKSVLSAQESQLDSRIDSLKRSQASTIVQLQVDLTSLVSDLKRDLENKLRAEQSSRERWALEEVAARDEFAAGERAAREELAVCESFAREQFAIAERGAREQLAAEQRESIDRFSTEIRRLEVDLASREQAIGARITESMNREQAWRDEVQTRIASLRQDARIALEGETSARKELRNELMLQGLLLTRALERPLSGNIGTDLTGSGNTNDHDRHTLDAFYAALEERFRGDPSEVKRRQRAYIPYLRSSGVISDTRPVLDLGCGRGEWLEVLRDDGVLASGVDLNALVVRECTERGLNVAEVDAISALSTRADQSLGAITGFHIAEHLSLESLINLIDVSFRTLHFGGVLIFETPNPVNIQVGSCNFYLDPTHRNPIPPAVLKFYLESRGFEEVEVLRINPSSANPVQGDSELTQRFNELFYGPMDYAVIGRKGQV